VDLTAASRAGVSRDASEDRWVAVTGDRTLVLAVADGMGGTLGGGAAATAALAALLDHLGSAPVTTDLLGAAVAAAHQRVRALAPDGLPVMLRPGTTLTAAAATEGRLHLAHVGDSSCWLLRRGRLRLLTEVHTHGATLVAAGAVERGSAAERRLGGLLTRFLGMPGTVGTQLATVRVRPGDRVLVATDGVTGALPVPDLAALLARPGVGAADLVRAAVEAGGRDDATALLVDMDTVPAARNTRYACEEAEVRAR
jgi:protein phosphatase